MAKKATSILEGIARAVLGKGGGASKTNAAITPPTVPAASGAATGKSGGKAGERMKFGPYEWLVLERKGDTALLITEGIIERGPYHSAKEGITWEGCDLRRYLNAEFLNKFDPADRARIIEVTNQNPGNPWYKTMSGAVVTSEDESGERVRARNAKGGNPTKDKVFLLSIDEVCRYFGDSTAQLKDKGFTLEGGKITLGPGTTLGNTTRISDQNDKNRIAIMPGALSTFNDKKDAAFRWWLRSPGEADILAAEITARGCVKITGSAIWAVEKRETGGIRPALWLKT